MRILLVRENIYERIFLILARKRINKTQLKLKKLLYIFIIVLVASCRNTTEKTALKKAILKNTVSEKEPSEINNVDSIKISAPFNINGIKCILKQIDSTSGATTLEFRDYKTQRILISFSDYFRTENMWEVDYFKENFVDLNFDGFKDFFLTKNGGSAMSDITNIYIFKEKTKSFELSEDLSDNIIEEVDSINRILSTSSFTIDNQTIKKNYFNKNGTIKYYETINKSLVSQNDTVAKYNNFYQKIVNDKVVETKEYITIE